MSINHDFQGSEKMSRPSATRISVLILVSVFSLSLPLAAAAANDEKSPPKQSVVHRSPVDLVLGGNGNWIATANETSNTVSLI
ncbi:MAG TPA: hypothetical protein P5307_05600, partial [Pirellulaceae bacterium]|nr:hypothetical protein [Pirellulaceae bacterium]